MHSMSEPPEIFTTPAESQSGSATFQESWSFLEDVKKRFDAAQPEVYVAVINALSSFYTTTQKATGGVDRSLMEVHETVKALLQGHADLIERFESSLPQDYLDRRRRTLDRERRNAPSH
ncbi:Putative paired amphipathic helix superfamily protein [Colletotrichum destructivum]|uniref:Paired amphipathic helix superfamily protein n=1 Tax=Colletotrichum destructivum TaxID=34406 RepID=A0AAX4IP86_9PEZI|nr:Putative paired amphipathic helix superfamily protein [Colletotrichum destructivum]